MGTIEVNGYVFDGVYCRNLGVYTHEDGHTYAGEHEGGSAHGYGVGQGSNGETVSAQYANGRWDGHGEVRWVNGDVGYYLWEHGNRVHFARVEANGTCFYDKQPCGADHAALVALKAAAEQAAVRMPHTSRTAIRRTPPAPRWFAITLRHCIPCVCGASGPVRFLFFSHGRRARGKSPPR